MRLIGQRAEKRANSEFLVQALERFEESCSYEGQESCI